MLQLMSYIKIINTAYIQKYIFRENTIKKFNQLIININKSLRIPCDDWKAWNKFMKHNKYGTQIVGDDLYVTNLERLKIGFLNQSSNSILIKLNQIGTVTETLEVIKFAQTIGFNTIISHRSGESEDTFIADLAVGTNSNQIKTGSLSRSERLQNIPLLRIEENLNKKLNMNNLK